MTTGFDVDSFKLMHWMNARKLTPQMVAARSGLSPDVIEALVRGSDGEKLSEMQASTLADVLNVAASSLAVDNDTVPDVLYNTKDEVLATCREIERGGIHFYNYYNLPAPKGFIAPVLIDILCPAGRVPTQNNGHLEPAITINLGPGHIQGLWAHEINDDTYHPFYANTGEESDWILGESYLEPSYCPHTYARHGDEPTTILSYTIKSNLESFLNVSNKWSDRAYENFLGTLDEGHFGAVALKSLMERHGYDVQTLSDRTGIGDNSITSFLEGEETALAVEDLRKIALLIGCDYRLLLPVMRNYDAVGKSWCTVEQSVRSKRSFKSYTVASMSVSPQYPDLMGLFMRVEKPESADELDLMDHSVTHYFVTGGKMTFRWQKPDGSVGVQSLSEGDALWVNAYVRHAYAGDGSLIKMGNGEGTAYLDHFEMSNTFDAAGALKRGRHDTSTWTPIRKKEEQAA